jgi:hypothetical protein
LNIVSSLLGVSQASDFWMPTFRNHLSVPSSKAGYEVAQIFEALHYKPKGRGFDSRWCNWNF